MCTAAATAAAAHATASFYFHSLVDTPWQWRVCVCHVFHQVGK